MINLIILISYNLKYILEYKFESNFKLISLARIYKDAGMEGVYRKILLSLCHSTSGIGMPDARILYRENAKIALLT